MSLNQTITYRGDFVDLQFAPRYTLDRSEASSIVRIYEHYDVEMPVEPPDHECINYGFPIDEQVFRKTYVPKDLEFWEQEEKEHFIEGEFHRRKNGIWVFIKGRKTYIPGECYFFETYWNLKLGEPVLYRHTDLEFFWMWYLCKYDNKCLGLIDFKCRQIGDTEKVLCIIYEYASRVRNVKCAMQSINETHIENTFLRLAYAHKKMVWFFKPINDGNDDPKGGLVFKIPSKKISVNQMDKQFKKFGTVNQANMDFEFDGLESEIQYGPSKEYYFDGQTYGLYYMDEFGKMESMDPVRTLGVIRPAMVSRILNKILGKMLLTSTVEELKSGNSLIWAKQLYEESDPTKRGEDGMTFNGLYRIFRGALDRAPVDHWGDPKADEESVIIQKAVAQFIAKGDIKGMIEYKRKNATSIDEVFMSANDESGFDIEKLAKRDFYLKHQAHPKPWVRGNLKWEDGRQDSRVVFIPNTNGKWYISRHPEDFKLESNGTNNRNSPFPVNIHRFCGGVDPYDQKTVLEKVPSKGGIAIFAKLDMVIDRDNFNEKNEPIDDGADFMTNRFVCTYCFRENDPNDFYEDVLKTMVYYGSDFIPEKNKSGGLLTYLELRGYSHYLMKNPTRKKNSRNQVEQEGITATEDTINSYFEFLQTLTAKWANTIDHPDLIEQLLTMNWNNRGQRDLGVAAGWALAASKSKVLDPKKQQKERKPVYFRTRIV